MSQGPTDPEQWVAEYGDVLYRYALVRVRRPEVAADLVQETLLDAWRGRAAFAGRSATATWLVGILRHKILDHFRKSASASPTEPADAVEEQVFSRRGKWNAVPGPWPRDPTAELEQAEFWDIFRGCLDRLPETLAVAFVLREIDDADTDTICQILDITPTNLWARLHRARLQLRACLERRWFDAP